MSDIARIDTILGKRAGAGVMLAEQFVAIEVKVTNEGYPTILGIKLINNMRYGTCRVIVINGNSYQL
jgi:hypothetical protein